MKKWLAGMIFIVMVVVILVVVVIFNLGTIVKIAINTYGPRLTKTEMRLSRADISLLKTQAQLENFVMGNPEGFSSPDAISVGSVLVKVDKNTLTQDTIIIDQIEVLGPVITYEIKGKTDNFRTIINNMKKPKKSKEVSKKEPAGKKGGKKVVIRDLVLKDITIKTAAAIAGGDIATTKISEIHLQNIGEKQNGVQVAQAVLIVLNELYGQIISPNILGNLKNQLKGLGSGLGGVKNEVKSLGGHLKGLMDRSAE